VINDDFEAAAGRLAAIVGGSGGAFRTDSREVRAAAQAVLERGDP
jgi:hypothetical protein